MNSNGNVYQLVGRIDNNPLQNISRLVMKMKEHFIFILISKSKKINFK